MRLVAAGFFLLLGAVCAQAAPADDLMAADRAFSRAAADHGRNYALLAVIAADGHIFDAAQPPVIGRGQAFRRLSRGRGRGTFSWTPQTARVAGDGRMGWTDGQWKSRAGKIQTSGHYLAVWVKQNGRWRVQARMDVPDHK